MPAAPKIYERPLHGKACPFFLLCVFSEAMEGICSSLRRSGGRRRVSPGSFLTGDCFPTGTTARGGLPPTPAHESPFHPSCSWKRWRKHNGEKMFLLMCNISPSVGVPFAQPHLLQCFHGQCLFHIPKTDVQTKSWKKNPI